MLATRNGVNSRPAVFVADAKAMRQLLADLNQRFERVNLGSNEQSRSPHVARGKLLAHSRINLEIGVPLAASHLYGGEVASARTIASVGRGSARECVVVAKDATMDAAPTHNRLSRSLTRRENSKSSKMDVLALDSIG
jgi:3-methylcrotonyl-CoA carboxylase beta subunit